MMTKPEDILTAYQHSTIIFPLQSDTADLHECTRQARRKLKHKQRPQQMRKHYTDVHY